MSCMTRVVQESLTNVLRHSGAGHAIVRVAAAAHLQRGVPGEGFAALEEIKRSSADALAELRSTLKLFRPAAGEAPMRPAHSLADLPELVDGVAGAGVDVELELDPMPHDLPIAVAYAAYRVVQESLTNVLRHSGAGHAIVRVALAEDLLTVEILDDGRTIAPHAASPGHGVQGMMERAAALGGRCEAGVVSGGGWRVRASLPARTASA